VCKGNLVGTRKISDGDFKPHLSDRRNVGKIPKVLFRPGGKVGYLS